MSNKPIFVATHPRACSTAFERVFMTRRDTLTCVHEPFGDAFYFGPERMSKRFENNKIAREASGFANSTFKTILDRMEEDSTEGKRLFIKDIAYYLVPPDGQQPSIAPSLGGKKTKKGAGINGANTKILIGETNEHTNGPANEHTNGLTYSERNGIMENPFPFETEAEAGNPTIIPNQLLKKFHFTFLIRHPRSSIPSYYRCTVPPLDEITGFFNFMPSEAGYDELRRVFDYLRSQKQIGPAIAGNYGTCLPEGEVSITVVDADDLLDNPNGIIEAYCREVGLEYTAEMLNWDTETDYKQAKNAFEKWDGFHNDAIDSNSLKPRSHARKSKTIEGESAEWLEKYGPEGQRAIRECVDKNIPDYEYLKSFAIKV